MFTWIRNAHVYAPEDMGIQDILLCSDRIIHLGKMDYDLKDDVKIIEAEGKICFPGFFDQHVHIIGGGGEDGFASLIREIQMTDCIRAGVTSAVGLLGTDANARSVEALVAKTKGLKEQGMSAWCLTGSYAVPSTTLTGSVSRDIAFVDEIIGVKTAISDHRSSQPAKQEIARLASQAYTAGLLAKKAGIVHMHTGRGKRAYRDILDLVAESDIPISVFRPTHVGNCIESAVEFAHAGGRIDFTSGNDTKHTARLIKETMAEVPYTRMTLSSDANGSFPKWSDDLQIAGMGVGKMDTLFDTVRHLIREEKVPAETAVSLITKNVAEGLKLYPQKGTIQVNSDADLVIVNPDLSLDTVIAMGRVMMKDGAVTAENYYDYD